MSDFFVSCTTQVSGSHEAEVGASSAIAYNLLLALVIIALVPL